MNLTKKVIEQYAYIMGDKDETTCMWADFNVEDCGTAGRLSIHSDFGDWNYYWNSCGKPFKQFLTGLNDDYLMSKLGKREVFIVDYDTMRKDVIDSRRKEYITKEEARTCYHVIDYLERNSYTDSQWHYILSCHCDLLYDKIYGNQYDELPISYDFSEHLKSFIKEVWPIFVNTLKEENAS
jgi:hypothetical protein